LLRFKNRGKLSAPFRRKRDFVIEITREAAAALAGVASRRLRIALMIARARFATSLLAISTRYGCWERLLND
ncbi:hypothetical protein ABE527_15930, partial [Brucella sp. TWI432]